MIAFVYVFPESWLVAFFDADFVPGAILWARHISIRTTIRFNLVYLSPPVWSILARYHCVVVVVHRRNQMYRRNQMWQSRWIQASCRIELIFQLILVNQVVWALKTPWPTQQKLIHMCWHHDNHDQHMLTAQLPAENFCLPHAEVLIITHSSPHSLVTHLVAMFHLQRCLRMISW